MADSNRHLTGILLCGQQTKDDDLLLKRLEHRSQRPTEVRGIASEVGGATHQQPLLGVFDEGFQQHGGRAADCITELAAMAGPGVELVGQVGHRHRGGREPLAFQRLPQQLTQSR